jgi:DNA-binding NarL/FixJ family response regulator
MSPEAHIEKIPASDSSGPASEITPRPKMRPRLMIVDDNDAFLAAMELLLPRIFPVEIATSSTDGRHALTALESTPVDLVLVDYKMPGFNGLAFTKRARERQLWPRILVISFNPTEELAKGALESGAAGLISKADIQEELKSYLARWYGCHSTVTVWP